MPTIYLRKDLYDHLVKQGEEPTGRVNEIVEEYLHPKVKDITESDFVPKLPKRK